MTPLLAIALFAPPCAPSASVSGALAADLGAALQARAVQVPPAEGCTGVSVAVEPDGDAVALRRGDEPPRTVPDLQTAALLVETWVRAELLDPLLAARLGPRRPAPLPPTPVRPVYAGLAIDGAWTTDNSSWIGLRGEGCIGLGWICPGARLRFLYDPGVSGETQVQDVWRIGLGAMATADVLLGGTRIGVGAGATAVRIDGDRGVDDVRGAPLFEVRASQTFLVGEAWALDVNLAADWALWPRGGRVQDSQNDADAALPGVPTLMVLGGVGFQWVAR